MSEMSHTEAATGIPTGRWVLGTPEHRNVPGAQSGLEHGAGEHSDHGSGDHGRR